MCAINGFNFKDRDLVERMNRVTEHRGPDGTGTFVDDNLTLGHNRLSVIDLSQAAGQPMYSHDQNLVIVFNGEIYNFAELRQLLQDYPFRTKSDTEVILAGYARWGGEVVTKLHGIFAFAIWDRSKRELFLARDRSGVKPLYYFWDGTRFVFSSEMKGILEHDLPRVVDHEAFNHYLRVLYAPAPYTMLKGISVLPPGSILNLSGGQVTVAPYIRTYIRQSQSAVASYDEARGLLRTKTMDAVRRQLVSDVPVGVYLSGGIDSSTVLFAALQYQKNINTFSVGFDLSAGEEREKFNHDFELAKRTAAFFGSMHHPLMVSGDEVARSFEAMAIQNDNPVSNPTAIAMLHLARRAKQDVTVVLTGNGGDEVFGGYERYRLALLASYYRRLPSFIRVVGELHPRIRKSSIKTDVDLFASLMFQKDAQLSRVIAPPLWNAGSCTSEFFSTQYLSRFSGDSVSRLMETDRASWLPDQALALADKMSMRAGIEERVPLLDDELVDFAISLPRRYKVTAFTTKKILRDAFRSDLPDFLFRQPKRGWFAPGAKWLRHPAVEQVAREVLSPSYYAGTKAAFKWDALSAMLDGHINKTEYNVSVLWALMTFQVWARHYRIAIG